MVGDESPRQGLAKPPGARPAHMVTPNARARFLEFLRKTGNVSYSAKEAGFARFSFYRLRKKDPDFAADWDDAVEEATDSLELEARRRALQGCDKPVYQKGELVGHVREYSDHLMVTLLRAHRPEKFRDRIDHEHRGDLEIHVSEASLADRLASLAQTKRANGHDREADEPGEACS